MKQKQLLVDKWAARCGVCGQVAPGFSKQATAREWLDEHFGLWHPAQIDGSER